MRIADLYQEHPQDTWSNNGVHYQVNKILEIVQDKEAAPFPLNLPREQLLNSKKSIEGQLVCGSCYEQTEDVAKVTQRHTERVESTDISIAIIIFKDESQWRVVDGAHRLEKAFDNNLQDIPAKIISKSEIETALV